jgi:D-glycero-D-manno-heptose 1,7-bisphosphate phosphatase
MHKAVFLDRDGVLNASVVRDGKPYPPANADEMQMLPGASEAVERLRNAGFTVLVATSPTWGEEAQRWTP